MLVLKLYPAQRIAIGDDIQVTYVGRHDDGRAILAIASSAIPVIVRLKHNDTAQIGAQVEVMIVSMGEGNAVKLGITAPRDLAVYRPDSTPARLRASEQREQHDRAGAEYEASFQGARKR